jgi:hypothetical protein
MQQRVARQYGTSKETLTSMHGSLVWQPYILPLASLDVAAATVMGFWTRSLGFSSRLIDVQLWHDVSIDVGFSKKIWVLPANCRFNNVPYYMCDSYCMVTLYLFGTAGCNRPIVHPLDNNMNEYGVSTDRENDIKEGNAEVLGKTFFRVLHRPLGIPTRNIWQGNRASVVKSRRLTFRAVARVPMLHTHLPSGASTISHLRPQYQGTQSFLNLIHPSFPVHRMTFFTSLLQQAALLRDCAPDCCYTRPSITALSFTLLLQQAK